MPRKKSDTPSSPTKDNDNDGNPPKRKMGQSPGNETSSKTVTSPPAKRQKKASPAPRKKAAPKAKAAAATTIKAKAVNAASTPTNILVIDNGGDHVKFGWHESTCARSVPNVTARLQQQWTVLVADQLAQIQNPNQLIGVTRSMERGIIVNMGNQMQVWKRILDLLGVNVALTLSPDVAKAFGWKLPTGRQQQNKKGTTAAAGTPEATIHPHSCAVILTVPPYCPRSVLDQIMMVWMEDFGFSHVGFYASPLISARSLCRSSPYETACVVDLGWSATRVLSTHQGRALVPSLRRLSLGARHLIKIWQYHCSYRQWNLMDQDFILRSCLEQTGYLSLNFKEDMALAQKWPLGLRPFDRDYILPDYQNTHEGRVRIPPSLERRLRQELDQDAGSEEDDDDDEDDEDVREEDMNEEDIEDDGDDDAVVTEEVSKRRQRGKNQKGKDAGNDDEDQDGDSEGDDDEEDEDALRKRLLQEREEEEKRKRQLELEQQVLRISVERFAILEALFRPSDVGLPTEWAGLAHTIHQSIQACPVHLRAAMYRSIHLVGGLSQLENIKERLEGELRTLVPCEYDVHVTITDNPTKYGWFALQSLVKEMELSQWAINRDEWEAASRRGAWRRLAINHGGAHVI